MSLFAASGALTSGLLFALVGLGVFVSFKMLRYPDLTIEGSFLLGAATSAALIQGGTPALPATIAGALAGAAAGYLTGTLSSRFHIPPVVAGILVATSAYSFGLLALRVPNVSVAGTGTVFARLENLALDSPYWFKLVAYPIALTAIAVAVKWILDLLLRSEFGMGLRAAGSNSRMAAAYGIDPDRAVRTGLAFANGLVGLAGALFAQVERFADVNMGFGVLISGLAAVFIGEALQSAVGRSTAIAAATTAVLLGAIVQRFSLAAAYEIGLPPAFFSLVTSACLLAFLLVPRFRQQVAFVMRRAQ